MHSWSSDTQLNKDETHAVPVDYEPGKKSSNSVITSGLGQEYVRRSVTINRPPRSQSVQYTSNNSNIGRRSESPLPLPPLPQLQTDLPHRTYGYGLTF